MTYPEFIGQRLFTDPRVTQTFEVMLPRVAKKDDGTFETKATKIAGARVPCTVTILRFSSISITMLIDYKGQTHERPFFCGPHKSPDKVRTQFYDMLYNYVMQIVRKDQSYEELFNLQKGKLWDSN